MRSKNLRKRHLPQKSRCWHRILREKLKYVIYPIIHFVIQQSESDMLSLPVALSGGFPELLRHSRKHRRSMLPPVKMLLQEWH